MKDELVALVRGTPQSGRLNVSREWLQASILKSLERNGAMSALAFHGGTALRFLHGIGRYSEDLDFAWHGSADESSQTLTGHLEALKVDLWNLGINSRATLARRPRIVEARFDFRALANELGLAPALTVKVEIGLAPPADAQLSSSFCVRHQSLQLRHYDRATMFAGKLHAILQRHYTKGRDYYDLLWYLGDAGWPEPNLPFLNDALRQTGWSRAALTRETWREAVLRRLAPADWAAARADVLPFLEQPEDVRLLSHEVLERALKAPRRPGASLGKLARPKPPDRKR